MNTLTIKQNAEILDALADRLGRIGTTSDLSTADIIETIAEHVGDKALATQLAPSFAGVDLWPR